MAEKFRDYYDLLGLPREATPQQIKTAYRRLVRQYHPDVATAPDARARFLAIQEAYHTLSHPERRAAYDASLPRRPLEAQVQWSRPALWRLEEPQWLYALWMITAHTEAATGAVRRPLNLSLAIDRSTSMRGERLRAVVRSALRLMDELQDDDVFSLVTFADRAEVIVPPRRGKPSAEVRQRLRQMQAEGGTEIYQGLRAAYQQVGRFYNPAYHNQILLITDGHTYGDEAASLRLARQARLRNITIYGLGIGENWNDAFLDHLTAITGGSAHLILSSRDLERFLEAHFHTLGTHFANNASLTLQLGSGVKLTRAFRLQPDPMPLPVDDMPLLLGHVPQDMPLQVVFEFLVQPLAAAQEEEITLLTGEWQAVLPGGGKCAARPLAWALPVTAQEAQTPPPPPQVSRAVQHMVLYGLQEQAQQDLSAGQVTQATRRLEQLATHLLAAGATDLARTVQQEVGRLRRTARLSEQARKAIKFGTRTLKLPAVTAPASHTLAEDNRSS